MERNGKTYVAVKTTDYTWEQFITGRGMVVHTIRCAHCSDLGQEIVGYVDEDTVRPGETIIGDDEYETIKTVTNTHHFSLPIEECGENFSPQERMDAGIDTDPKAGKKRIAAIRDKGRANWTDDEFKELIELLASDGKLAGF